MLILTRKISETLMVGNDIRVTVVGVDGNQVKIGIDAPREISVDREEIYLKKLRQGEISPSGRGVNSHYGHDSHDDYNNRGNR